MKKCILYLLTFALIPVCNAQYNVDRAKQLTREAIKLEDSGKVNEALKLLAEAEKIDPDSYSYPYEIGYAYYAMQNYHDALEAIKRAIKKPNANDQCYQMEGNIYDYMGNSDAALKAYADALKRFPNSGKLYLETGNVYFSKDKFDQAMPYYEKGIKADPVFPSNYYRAAMLYLHSDQAVWGMLYAEIFMNLERGSKRTGEVSGWLYDAYRKRIVKKSDTSYLVSFCKTFYINPDDLKGDKPKFPFAMMVYEPIFSMLAPGSIKGDSMNLDEMCKIRTAFLNKYYEDKSDEQYPNVLFEYQQRIKEAGHIDAYNHWLLQIGDKQSFSKWREKHAGEYSSFAKWFTENPINITPDHMFSSSQY